MDSQNGLKDFVSESNSFKTDILKQMQMIDECINSFCNPHF